MLDALHRKISWLGYMHLQSSTYMCTHTERERERDIYIYTYNYIYYLSLSLSLSLSIATICSKRICKVIGIQHFAGSNLGATSYSFWHISLPKKHAKKGSGTKNVHIEVPTVEGFSHFLRFVIARSSI